MLIVDTQGKEAYYYRNLILLANSVGFQTAYKNLYDLLENPNIDAYQALFFMLSPSMITMSSTKHFFTKLCCLLPTQPAYSIPEHCWNALRSFAQQKNKAIAIILPGQINYNPQLQQCAQKAVERIGNIKQLDPQTKKTLHSFISYITTSDAQKGSIFGTSLINPGAPKFPAIDKPTKNMRAVLTPIHADQYTHRAQQALPIGLLLQVKKQNNTYLISKSSEFDFADVCEHFFKNPLSICDRNELLKAAQETLLAFRIAYETSRIPEKVETPRLPEPLTIEYLQRAKKQIAQRQQKEIDKSLYSCFLNRNGSLAWLDPYDFYAHEDAHQKIKLAVLEQYPQLKTACQEKVKAAIELTALQRGIRSIYDAQFTSIWFEFVPEWYLSEHGIRKEQRDEYVQRIRNLAQQLSAFFAARGARLPKLFLGINLTSNFRSYPVENAVQNLSGATYTKIPCPFDVAHFWKPEVLDVFDSFLTQFKDCIPIDGVFFDLEMYHAPDQTGAYTDQMDFSDMAWQAYCLYSHDKNAADIKTVKKRVAYLQKTKKFTQYFSALEQASKDLGAAIKRHMRKQIPNLLFGAYAPTLPYSWFYRGFMAGLSSPSQPLILATFNTDYASHYAWLAKHHVHLLHGSAIMLSKLKQDSDFSLISSILTHHDFVWYNRPSRMIYQYSQPELDTVWWGIEATPLSAKQLMAGIKKHHSTHSPQQVNL